MRLATYLYENWMRIVVGFEFLLLYLLELDSLLKPIPAGLLNVASWAATLYSTAQGL